jgi:hypothetical protein
MIELLERAKTAEMAASVSAHLPMVAAGKRIEADVFRQAYVIATEQSEKEMKEVFDRALSSVWIEPNLKGAMFRDIMKEVTDD